MSLKVIPVIVGIVVLYLLASLFLSFNDNGNSVAICALRHSIPIINFDFDDGLGKCPTNIGQNAKTADVCNLLLYGRARNVCRGEYAIQHNDLEICAATGENDMAQKPNCLTKLAVKNKDISLCDKTEANARDYVRESCRNEVYRSFQLSNASGHELFIGTVKNTNTINNSFLLVLGYDIPDHTVSTYDGNGNTAKMLSKNGEGISLSDIKNGDYVRVYGGTYTKINGVTVDSDVIRAFTIIDDSIN